MTGCYIPIPVVCDECSKAPHIGDNGNWWIGETDTGVKAQGTGGEEYSTTAVRIGTWIDGKPLYRRVFQYRGLIPANSVTTAVPESRLVDFNQIVKLYGYATNASTLALFPLPNAYLSLAYRPSMGINIGSNVSEDFKDAEIMIEYT